jgi:hypothetical protein
VAHLVTWVGFFFFFFNNRVSECKNNEFFNSS